jgi:hypothetical protein
VILQTVAILIGKRKAMLEGCGGLRLLGRVWRLAQCMHMSKGSMMKRRCRNLDCSVCYSYLSCQDSRLQLLAKASARNFGQGQEDTDAPTTASSPGWPYCMMQDHVDQTEERNPQLGEMVLALLLAGDRDGVAESLGPPLRQDHPVLVLSKASFQRPGHRRMRVCRL